MSSTSTVGSGPPPPPRTKRPQHLAAAGGPGDSMTIIPQQQQRTGLPQHISHKGLMLAHNMSEGLFADHLAPIAGSGVNAVRQRTPTYHELSSTPNLHIGRGKNNADSIRPISPSSLTTGVPETVIGEYVNVKGELAFDRLLRIDGCFEGKLISDGDLIVGPQGKLIGDVVNIRSVLVEGHLIGNLVVESVALKGDAYVHGDITCKSMTMEAGAKLVGRVNIHPAAPREMDAEGNVIIGRAKPMATTEAIPANHVETDAPESKIKGEFHFPKSKEDEQNALLSASESKKTIPTDAEAAATSSEVVAETPMAEAEAKVEGDDGAGSEDVSQVQKEIQETKEKAAHNRESEEREINALRAEAERLKAEDQRLAEAARQRKEAAAAEVAQLQTAVAEKAEEEQKPAEEATT